ncbi:MAG: MFS transporter [Anaerolineales bacterium]|nr:MFS transporter [Anaerolineales bacterium]
MKSTQRLRSRSSKHLAFELIILLGIVSALGDITYETGRSVSGPYLAFLGAGAIIVGLVSGLGEFLGYALRLVSGYFVDRSRFYWLATFIGYGLILSIPLLAFANRWELAALLYLLERIGKAIRTPARDVILSHAASQVGRGWGFAIHEALDQVGAVIGPLIFAAVFIQRESYRDGFAILWIPALLTMVTLIVARLRVPAPEVLECSSAADLKGALRSKQSLPPIFWIYGLFTFFGVAGFANFQIVSYHLVTKAVFQPAQIPILYAVAMGVDAVAALVIGKVYDKIGFKSLAFIPFLTLPLPVFLFSQGLALVVIGVVLWGIVMAVHETVMRAAIADLVARERRAFAYGIFNTVYGIAWFISGAAMGLLYSISSNWLIVYVVAMEAAAIFVLLKVGADRLSASEWFQSYS